MDLRTRHDGMAERDIPFGVFHFGRIWVREYQWVSSPRPPPRDTSSDARTATSGSGTSGSPAWHSCTSRTRRHASGTPTSCAPCSTRASTASRPTSANASPPMSSGTTARTPSACTTTTGAMAESLRGGLSLALSGFGFWSHDIGGFEGTPDPAVFKRRLAFGLLSSHSRLHGNDSYRVPWAFGDEAVAVARKFTLLKHRLPHPGPPVHARPRPPGRPPARCSRWAPTTGGPTATGSRTSPFWSPRTRGTARRSPSPTWRAGPRPSSARPGKAPRSGSPERGRNVPSRCARSSRPRISASSDRCAAAVQRAEKLCTVLDR